MTELRKASRRSFLKQVAGGAVGVGAMGLVGGEAAVAAATTILDPARTSDSDPSDAAPQNDSDPVGTNTRGGCSDSDRGRNADPINRGRRCRNNNGRRYTGVSDSDTGNRADPHGYGTGRRRACSDSDRGRNADQAGRGRRC